MKKINVTNGKISNLENNHFICFLICIFLFFPVISDMIHYSSFPLPKTGRFWGSQQIIWTDIKPLLNLSKHTSYSTLNLSEIFNEALSDHKGDVFFITFFFTCEIWCIIFIFCTQVLLFNLISNYSICNLKYP